MASTWFSTSLDQRLLQIHVEEVEDVEQGSKGRAAGDLDVVWVSLKLPVVFVNVDRGIEPLGVRRAVAVDVNAGRIRNQAAGRSWRGATPARVRPTPRRFPQPG